ncbi:HDOD domain-containing protein [Malonomonas rubra]|nr:HDOD domain-containing protein [Malonomonas rubra]
MIDMQRIYLKDRSFAVDNLPSEAGLLVELLDLCSNDDAGFEQYTQAIKKDAGLTSQFLKLANSPLYRQWNELTDLKRMLVVLGLKNIRKIIITSAVQNFFSKLAKSKDPQQYQLWLRSLLCAHLAEQIARKIGYPKTEEAYLAGLLHQVGILLLLINYKENYQQILEHYENGRDFCELEQTNYGIDHCEVGATLIESWQLDSLISDAIQFQHSDTEQLLNSPTLLKIVSVASALSSPPDTDVAEEDITKAGDLLQLLPDICLECLAMALDDTKQVLAQLGFPGVHFNEEDSPEAVMQARDQKADELAERIKNIALTHCFLNGESKDISSLVKELRINLDLLFNLKQICFFSLTPDGSRLVADNDLKLAKLDEIAFNLSDKNSVLVKSFNQGQTLDSMKQQGSIIDRQLTRILGAECACFLPVSGKTEKAGVLAIGSSRKELPGLKEKLPLLELLLIEIGKKYLEFNAAEPDEENISMTEFNKIVHEVKNPLTIINNYLYILGRKLEEDHPALEEIDFIKEEMERVGVILANARERQQQPGGAQQVDLNKLIHELNDFFGNSLYNAKEIEPQLHLDLQLPVLQLPENSLKQVIINIVKNAVEAMQEKGSISISTRDNCFQNGNRFVELSIRDNGPGIPDHVLQNLFRPVESTKKGHSGLGLSIVADLIKEMSGTISCYSSQGAGTEFKILLPRLIESLPAD